MTYESDSSLKLYLRVISKNPLLTAEDKVLLAQRIKNGDEKVRMQMNSANLLLVVNNPHFPALRSDPMALSAAVRREQSPSSPLFTISQQKLTDDFVKSMLDFYNRISQETLPMWSMFHSEYTYMICLHALPDTVDAYNKGLSTNTPEE